MKHIIIGLGNFGASLGEKLTKKGHEVIGVDSNIERVELYKDKLTHTICLDATDEQAILELPIQDSDTIIVAIGENEGANIISTALFKNVNAKRVISRSINPIHQKILKAIGVEEIMNPEEETAEKWSKKLSLQGLINSFALNQEYSVVETVVPKKYIGKTILEINNEKNIDITILTTIKKQNHSNQIHGIATPSTHLNENDLLVLFGSNISIKRFLSEK